jgi:hypothetical protein
MADWTRLRHAYGPADDVPNLLSEVSPDPDALVWDDGEFPAICPGCIGDLYVVIGDRGFFTASDDRVRNPDAGRKPILPRDGALPPAGAWMLDRASAADQREFCAWVRYLFGTSACPRCGRAFAVPEALSDGSSPS